MDKAKIVFIVNPRAGNGAAERRWPAIRNRAAERLASFQALFTSGPGDATRLTRRHLQEGAETIICVGGDGTFHEIVNGFMEENGPLRRDARAALLPAGTGSDFARTVPSPADLNRFFDLVSAGRGRFIDLGRLRFRDFSNRPCTRYFHNIVSFGIGGDVVRLAAASSRPFAGLYVRAALRTLWRREKKRIRLRIDGGPEHEMAVWNIAVANGRFHGGGMCVAPEAAVDDGLFHVTVIGDISTVRAFLHFRRLYDGRIGSIKQVLSFTGRQVEASSEEPVLIEMDGELHGRLPLSADIVPGALFLIAEA